MTRTGGQWPQQAGENLRAQGPVHTDVGRWGTGDGREPLGKSTQAPAGRWPAGPQGGTEQQGQGHTDIQNRSG